MKIAICIPARDTVHSGFALSLANLTARLAKNNIDHFVLFNLGSVIANQRNYLVRDALEKGASHLLWLDSDMHFPTNIVEKLLSYNRDIVAGTYSTRIKPQRSVAFTNQYNLNERLSAKQGLHEVFAVGLGCMLVSAEVYRNLPQPWFQYVWNTDTQDLSGEDIHFCKLATDNGYKIYVDADISEKIAHFGTKAFIIQETHEYNKQISKITTANI